MVVNTMREVSGRISWACEWHGFILILPPSNLMALSKNFARPTVPEYFCDEDATNGKKSHLA
jgi:hypothetical protein